MLPMIISAAHHKSLLCPDDLRANGEAMLDQTFRDSRGVQGTVPDIGDVAGEYTSITELAKAEDVNQSYACRVLRLSLLAPSIVTAILDGRHNAQVMLKDLMKPMPVHWDAQISALNPVN
jgi:hypothetical protein